MSYSSGSASTKATIDVDLTAATGSKTVSLDPTVHTEELQLCIDL